MNSRKNIFSVIISLAFLCFLSTSLPSQWYYSAYLEQEFNSNPFGLPDGADEQISRISMGIQKDWNSVSAQYFGSYMNFYRNPERNLYWQQLYVSGGEKLNWTMTVENRINRQTFSVYDYLTFRGGLNYNLDLKGSLLRFGGTGSFNRFNELSELDNLLLTVYSSLNRSLVTRTTIIAAVSFNYKYYLNEEFTQPLPADTIQNMMLSVDGIDQGGPGPGHGGGEGGGSYYYSTISSEDPAVSQLVLSVRLAQSVMKYTGLAVQYTQRISLGNYDRSLAGLIYGYDSESQIFDDPMGYEAQIAGLEMTQLFPLGFSLKLAGYLHSKNYTVQGIYHDAFTYDTSVLRDDTFRTVWFTLSKRFYFSDQGAEGLGVQLNYQRVDNSSNSYWYNYKSQYISVVLQLDM